ncbi:MAG TPA: carboxypeptidase regulatory-like domain-containing protein [Bryobacteraceae bacterium]
MALFALTAASAADIAGTVVIQHRLTKPKVTLPLGSYERGVAVDLNSSSGDDPLVAERSRVVVYVEGDLPADPRRGTMEQHNRQFVPETLVVPVGSTVSFPNLDPIFHNVFSLSKARSFDLGNYPKDHTRTVTFTKPGIVFVNCHLHPNMAAAIVITPNDWGVKSDSAGRFSFSDLPPGTYTITAWHRAAGFFHQTIRVTDGAAAAVTFTIPLGDPEPVRTTARR